MSLWDGTARDMPIYALPFPPNSLLSINTFQDFHVEERNLVLYSRHIRLVLSSDIPQLTLFKFEYEKGWSNWTIFFLFCEQPEFSCLKDLYWSFTPEQTCSQRIRGNHFGRTAFGQEFTWLEFRSANLLRCEQDTCTLPGDLRHVAEQFVSLVALGPVALALVSDLLYLLYGDGHDVAGEVDVLLHEPHTLLVTRVLVTTIQNPKTVTTSAPKQVRLVSVKAERHPPITWHCHVTCWVGGGGHGQEGWVRRPKNVHMRHSLHSAIRGENNFCHRGPHSTCKEMALQSKDLRLCCCRLAQGRTSPQDCSTSWVLQCAEGFITSYPKSWVEFPCLEGVV